MHRLQKEINILQWDLVEVRIKKLEFIRLEITIKTTKWMPMSPEMMNTPSRNLDIGHSGALTGEWFSKTVKTTKRQSIVETYKAKVLRNMETENYDEQSVRVDFDSSDENNDEKYF